MKFGDLGEVVIGGEELGLEGLCDVEEFGIDALAVVDGAFMDAEVKVWNFL